MNTTTLDILAELEQRAVELEQFQSQVVDIDTLQPLIDLGYLTFDQCTPQNAENRLFLKTAIKQFRQDYDAHQLIKQRFTFLPFDSEHYHNYAHQLNEIEQTFIQNLVSFDGDFLLHQLPKFGQVSLASRVVHYRLEILGLYGQLSHQGIDAPFTNESFQGLAVIKDFFSWNISSLEFLNSVGNIEILIDKIYTELDKGDVNKKFIYMDEHGNFDTTKILSKPKPAITQYYGFLARIFQIRLWMNGLYNGEIDGIIRNDNHNKYSTKKAIEEFVHYLKKDEDLKNDAVVIQKNIKLKKLSVKHFYNKSEELQSFWLNVVDLLFFTKSMRDETEEEAIADLFIEDKDGIPTIKSRNKRLKKKLFKKDGHFEEQVKLEVKKRNQDFLKGKKRRLYYGMRQFGRTIHRAIRNLFRGVARGIKLGFNLLKRVSTFIYREVKEGVKIFIHGMRFLVGKRTISTISENEAHKQNSIVSQFDLDFDSRLFISDDSNTKTIRKHNEKCTNQINSLNVSLIVTALVLRWVLILTTGSVGWTSLLLMLAKTMKKIKKTKFGSHINRVLQFV